MKFKNYLIVFMLFSFINSFSQVGIGTAAPDAQLDIRSSNQVAPSITDGILIPKIDTFPAVNPTIAQQGMLVYLTTPATFLATSRLAGFYYWNGTTDWVGISSSANGDHDWYEQGSTLAPDNINDNMFHVGNVAIGKNTANYPLEVSTSNFNIGVNNLFASGTTNALDKTGFYNSVSGTSNDTNYGIYNTLNSTGTGLKYGNYNFINAASGGTHYGIYSSVLKPGATNFAGYFLGNVGIGTTALNIYTFPASRGALGQVMRTDGDGNVTWANNSDFSWSLNGNATVSTNFIGTTNAQPFRLYANNLEAMRIISNGNVGVNTVAPVSKLEVTSNSATFDTFLSKNTNANGTAVNGVGQNGIYNGLVAGSGASFSGVSTGTFSFYTSTGAGETYYGSDNYGAFWRMGHWTGTGYRKIIGNGSVSTIVPDTNDEMVVMNCPESPENLFMDYGVGKLVNGKIYIKIDPILKKNIIVNELHPLKVFIQLEGECNGVYVTNKSNDGFEVVELNQGNSNISFSYNIVATMGDQKTTSKEGLVRVAKYDTRWEKAPKLRETIDNGKIRN